MPYRVTNLAYTRRDPNKRGTRNPFINSGRVMIGNKRMKDGRAIVISDSVYSSCESVINRYIQCGIIKVEQLGVSLEQLHAPSPTPPAPPEPTVENKAREVVEIDIIGDEPKEDVVTIQMGDDVVAEQAIVVAPVVEATPEVKTSAEDTFSNKATKKATRKPRRKRNGGE